MNILTLISRNWRRGPQTQRYPDRQAPSADYRGRVELDPQTCRCCSKCAQVCVSSAITFERIEGDRYEWAYDPARCTYCGICVTYCPVDCLWQSKDRGPSWAQAGECAETVTVIKPRRKKAARAPRPTVPDAASPEAASPDTATVPDTAAVAVTDARAALGEGIDHGC